MSTKHHDRDEDRFDDNLELLEYGFKQYRRCINRFQNHELVVNINARTVVESPDGDDNVSMVGGQKWTLRIRLGLVTGAARAGGRSSRQ